MILTKYIKVGNHQSKYNILPDNGTFYGDISGWQGVYANKDTLAATREELAEVLSFVNFVAAPKESAVTHC